MNTVSNVEFNTAFTLGVNEADEIIVQYEEQYITPNAEIDEQNTTSETLSEGMLETMMEQNPVGTVYLVTEVINPDDMDEVIGWAVLAEMNSSTVEKRDVLSPLAFCQESCRVRP